MSSFRRWSRLVLALLAAAGCDRRERVVPVRPSEPTLTVHPDPNAPRSGRRVVATAQIAQPWHGGLFAPASITLPGVEAGDAIVVLGVYWGDLPAGTSTAPTDTAGVLKVAVDQGPSIVGRTKPPVFAQLYVELDAAPGSHTIVPPYLGGPAGDGTMYVIQIRGLTDHRVVATGKSWRKSAAIADVFVALGGSAEPGDFVVALGGYDNTEQRDHAGWSHPPPGWTGLGVQEDAANNVPSELCYQVAPAAGPQGVTWTWTDPKVNVAAAVIAAFR
jgi:hypothetical protein